MPETTYETIICEIKNDVLHITINRPQTRNAFNARMIDELIEVFSRYRQCREIVACTITGCGDSFCAGADLNYMKALKDGGFDENYRDAQKIAEMFYCLYMFEVPTFAAVNGHALGGGMGFVTACDIAVASHKAVFSLSEVKIGLVPACISPYLIRKIPEGFVRELMLTGERLNGEQALKYGLINHLVQPEELNSFVESRIEMVRHNGPEAMKVCKELLREIPRRTVKDSLDYTAEVIAKLRGSKEGQEGMTAFLEKRKPRFKRNSAA